MRITVLLVILTLTPVASAQLALPAAFAKNVPETVQDLKDIENHVQDLVERVMPATVCLRVGNAQGSGVIINREGYILTAGHVSGANDRDITIILPDGRRLKGRSLGANNGIDSGMCLITEKAEFRHLDMARSADLKKGQWCLSLGHPGGYKPGRPPVVRLGRLQEIGKSQLVSDCALVGGDSGGPLFDMHGKVIGIHSQIGGPITSNLHVPVDTYRDTWDRLAAGEEWGNAFRGLGKGADAYMGLRLDPESTDCRILTVNDASPAAKAGLRPNDIVRMFDGKKIASQEELLKLIQNKRPGNEVALEVLRGEDTVVLRITLGKRPE